MNRLNFLLMDFQKTITVATTDKKVVEALTAGVNRWWGNIDNTQTMKEGDEFSIYFEENTEWRFVVSKLNLNKEVHWKCIYANHSYGGVKGIKEEWLNSEIKWTINQITPNDTNVHFEHIGLTPDLNCYEMCHAGWTHFVANSLKQYLETGKGQPNLVTH